MIFYEKNKTITQLYTFDKNLGVLANELETDKGTTDKLNLSWGSKYPQHYTWGYTDVYQQYMSAYRETDHPITFLEVGICDKRFPFASPKLWLSYFKNIDLYCVDNFWGKMPIEKDVSYLNEMGVNLFYADQGLPSDWDGITDYLHNKVDFIVEDGSHQPYHMFYTLWRSIALLKSGGYYFMEDLQDYTTRGNYKYDNMIVYESIIDFIKTGHFNSPMLNREMCEEIENSLKVVQIYFGGPEHTRTGLVVFQKI